SVVCFGILPPQSSLRWDDGIFRGFLGLPRDLSEDDHRQAKSADDSGHRADDAHQLGRIVRSGRDRQKEQKEGYRQRDQHAADEDETLVPGHGRTPLVWATMASWHRKRAATTSEA